MPTGGNFPGCGPDGSGVCDPITTTGLCLADGTPIGVVVTRDCATGEITQAGWVNLTTGVYSDGAPPAGAVACGDSRSIQVSGVFCDLLGDGTVAGLVLVEYQYAADGSIESTRLVDAATGEDYTLQGELSVCPAGVEQPEQDLTVLCDLTDAGPVPFLRDYRRDENGQVIGHADYDLDGGAYTPTGSVTLCGDLDDESPAEPCLHCQTLQLCDVTTQDVSPGEGTEVPWALVSVEPDPEAEVPGRGFLFTLSPEDDPSQTAVVRVTSGTTANTTCPPQGPDDLVFHNTNDLRFELDEVAQSASYLRVDLIDFDGFEPVTIHSDSPEPTRLGGTAVWNDAHTEIVATEDNGTGEMYWDSPPPEFGYRIWNTGGGTSCSQLSFAMATIVYPDPPPGSEVSKPFLRTICRDCAGEVVSSVDTELDGVTPYAPVGDVRACDTAPRQDGSDESPAEPEPCRNTTTVLLCDVPNEGVAGEPAVTDVLPETRPTSPALPGGGGDLWSGGSLQFPAEAGTDNIEQTYRAVAASVQAARPECDNGTATITASVHVIQNGPDAGRGYSGSLKLLNGNGAQLGNSNVPVGVEPGWDGTLAVTATVPAGDLAAGSLRVHLELETGQGPTRKSWTADQFQIGYAYDVSDCASQFLRHITVDCVTGDVVSTSDTTLDGEPYTPTGDVGQCQPTSGEPGEPDCPRSFSTECVATVTSEVTYDNTSCFVSTGECSDCGTIQGPGAGEGDNAGPAFPCTGQFQITSWIIDGAEVVVAPATFTGDDCGVEPGHMHTNWAAALSALDPGATWEARVKPGCAAYVGASNVPAGRVYGPMTITGTAHGGGTGTWTLGPATFCEETPYTRVFTQECDGSVSLSYLDADGNPVDAPPEGLVPCGACSGGGSGGGDTNPALTDCEDGPALRVVLCETGSPGDESPGEPTHGDVVECCENPTDGVTGTPDVETFWFNRIQLEFEPWEAQTSADVDPSPLWTGGSIVIPADPDGSAGDGNEVWRGIAGRIFPPERPACDDGSVVVDLGFEFTNNGDAESPPSKVIVVVGKGTAGSAEIPALPPGETATVPVSAPVKYADLVDGYVHFGFSVQTFNGAVGIEWTVSGFTASYTFGTEGCGDCGQAQLVKLCEPIVIEPGEQVETELITRCACDDTDGDGIADVDYVQVWRIFGDGATPALVGTYRSDMAGPYTPVNPVDCEPDGESPGESPDPGGQVRARRVVLATADTWTAAFVTGLVSVSVLVRAGSANVTDEAGTTNMVAGETASWSADSGGTLAGPLVVAASSPDADVVVNFTYRTAS